MTPWAIWSESKGSRGVWRRIGKYGQLALTTPAPVQDFNVKMITARGVEPAVQQELFAEFLAGAGAPPRRAPRLPSPVPCPAASPRGRPSLAQFCW